MNSGIIGKIDGDFDRIEGFEITRTVRDFELIECLDVRPGQLTLSGELRLQRGRAIIEDLEEVPVPNVEDGQIDTDDEWQKVFQLTEFLLVPGEFVLVDGTDGEFLFEMIEEMTDTIVNRPTIDLDAYAEERPEANPWKYGFDHAGGNAENGIVYGENVTDDPDMGDVLERSDKNQLGLEFTYSGRQTMVDVSESGFVRMIEPSINAENFISFISEELQPHW